MIRSKCGGRLRGTFSGELLPQRGFGPVAHGLYSLFLDPAFPVMFGQAGNPGNVPLLFEIRQQGQNVFPRMLNLFSVVNE